MADYTHPSTSEFYIKALEWGIRSNVLVSTSIMNGAVQTVELPGARWVATITYDLDDLVSRAALEAFWAKVRGRVNRVLLHHTARPAPQGTMRGSPTVYSSPIAVGATSFVIQSTIGVTIKPGDMLALGSGGQLVMVTNEYTGDGNGRLTCEFTPPCRTQVSAGSAVVWDKPTARFVLQDSEVLVPYESYSGPEFSISLVEVF